MAGQFSILRFAVALVVSVLVIAPRARGVEPDERMQTITLVDNENIIVRLIVAHEVSLLHDEWLALELENPSSEEIKVDLDYRMSWSIRDPKTGEQLVSNNLGAGQTFDLTGSTSPYALPPGARRRFARGPSCAASCLCLARESVIGRRHRVEARLHLTVVEAPSRAVVGQIDDKAFEFVARPPQAAELPAFLDKLRALLREPVDSMDHVYRLSSLLEVPAVANGLSTQELWDAADRRSRPFEGQETILDYLLKHRDEDQELIALATSVVAARDEQRLKWLGSEFWQDAWVPQLVDWWLESPRNLRPLELLHWHSGSWKNDVATRTRLSEKVRELYPKSFAVAGAPGAGGPNAVDARQVAFGFKVAAMTHDPTLVAALLPWLDDRRELVSKETFKMMLDPLPDSKLRVCDAAADAILILTGLAEPIRQDPEVEKLHPMTRRLDQLRPVNAFTKIDPSQRASHMYAQMLKYNDAVIQKLLAKLNDSSPAKKP